jgi:hypothetical protein
MAIFAATRFALNAQAMVAHESLRTEISCLSSLCCSSVDSLTTGCDKAAAAPRRRKNAEHPMNAKIVWPMRIIARAQRIAGGKTLLEICERKETLAGFLERIRIGAKPVTALSAPLLKELPDEQARAHALKQLAGEATAHLCENVLGLTRSSGSRAILDDPLFSSGTGFRERSAATTPEPTDDATNLQVIVESFLAALPNAGLHLLETAIASEQEKRRVAG